jgi:hypothetical protein
MTFRTVKRTFAIRIRMAVGALMALVSAAGGIKVPMAMGHIPPGREVVAVHWFPSEDRPVGGAYVVRVGIRSGYCYGGAKPYVDHVKVVERPRSVAYPTPSVVITPYVVLPPDPSPELCGGIGITLVKPVTLKRPVADLYLFDGSFDPARLMQRPTLATAEGQSNAS